VSSQEGGSTSSFRAWPGQPPDARRRAPLPGLSPEEGPGFPCPGDRVLGRPFHKRVFESLLVWPLPWDHFALGDPTKGYCPRQHSSQGDRGTQPPYHNKVAILGGVACNSRNVYKIRESEAYVSRLFKYSIGNMAYVSRISWIIKYSQCYACTTCTCIALLIFRL